MDLMPTCWQIIQLTNICLLAHLPIHSLAALLTAASLWCTNERFSPKVSVTLIDCVQAKKHDEAMNQLIKAGYVKTRTEGLIYRVGSSLNTSLHPL